MGTTEEPPLKSSLLFVTAIAFVLCSRSLLCLALAAEDHLSGKLEEPSQELTFFSPNSTNETQKNSSSEDYGSSDNVKSAGVYFPTLEDIRESFRRFQSQLNKWRSSRGSSSSDNSSSPYHNGTIFNFGPSNFPSGSSSSSPSFKLFGFGDPSSPDNRYLGISPSPDESRDKNFNYVYRYNPPDTAAELQQHTTTTIYIICICLVIMIVGSVLFVCVSKCQDARSKRASNNGQAGRHGGSSARRRNSSAAGASSANNRNSNLSVNTISIVMPPSADGSPSTSRGSRGAGAGDGDLSDPSKVNYDLPPSYESLFPNGKEEVV